MLGGAGDDVLLIDAADDLTALRCGAGLDIVRVVGHAAVAMNLWQTEVKVFEGGRGGDYVVRGKADDALSGEVGGMAGLPLSRRRLRWAALWPGKAKRLATTRDSLMRVREGC